MPGRRLEPFLQVTCALLKDPLLGFPIRSLSVDCLQVATAPQSPASWLPTLNKLSSCWNLLPAFLSQEKAHICMLSTSLAWMHSCTIDSDKFLEFPLSPVQWLFFILQPSLSGNTEALCVTSLKAQPTKLMAIHQLSLLLL